MEANASGTNARFFVTYCHWQLSMRHRVDIASLQPVCHSCRWPYPEAASWWDLHVTTQPSRESNVNRSHHCPLERINQRNYGRFDVEMQKLDLWHMSNCADHRQKLTTALSVASVTSSREILGADINREATMAASRPLATRSTSYRKVERQNGPAKCQLGSVPQLSKKLLPHATLRASYDHRGQAQGVGERHQKFREQDLTHIGLAAKVKDLTPSFHCADVPTQVRPTQLRVKHTVLFGICTRLLDDAFKLRMK